MKVPVRKACLIFIEIVFVSTAMAAVHSLPACDSQLITRHGKDISIGLDALSKRLNSKLNAAHTAFSDLQLTSNGSDLKVSGKKNGTPISISGPLQVTGKGLLRLHATQIHKNGAGVEGIMSLFGENLSDDVNLKKTQSMSVQGDNLLINPDKLLGLHGRATKVKIEKSGIELRFASQPCR